MASMRRHWPTAVQDMAEYFRSAICVLSPTVDLWNDFCRPHSIKSNVIGLDRLNTLFESHRSCRTHVVLAVKEGLIHHEIQERPEEGFRSAGLQALAVN